MELLKEARGHRHPARALLGAGPAMQAVLGNQVPLASTALPPAHPQIKSGKVIGLAENGAKRWSTCPICRP